MTARLIEGQFPNYEAVIPKGHPGKLVIARGALTAALRRVSVMAEERNKPVKLILAPAALRLTAASQDLGEAEETAGRRLRGRRGHDRLQFALRARRHRRRSKTSRSCSNSRTL